MIDSHTNKITTFQGNVSPNSDILQPQSKSKHHVKYHAPDIRCDWSVCLAALFKWLNTKMMMFRNTDKQSNKKQRNGQLQCWASEQKTTTVSRIDCCCKWQMRYHWWVPQYERGWPRSIMLVLFMLSVVTVQGERRNHQMAMKCADHHFCFAEGENEMHLLVTFFLVSWSSGALNTCFFLSEVVRIILVCANSARRASLQTCEHSWL